MKPILFFCLFLAACGRRTAHAPALIYYDRVDHCSFTSALLDSLYYASTNTGMYAIACTGRDRDSAEMRHKQETLQLFIRFLRQSGTYACRLFNGHIEIISGSDDNTATYDTTKRVSFVPNMGYW